MLKLYASVPAILRKQLRALDRALYVICTAVLPQRLESFYGYKRRNRNKMATVVCSGAEVDFLVSILRQLRSPFATIRSIGGLSVEDTAVD